MIGSAFIEKLTSTSRQLQVAPSRCLRMRYSDSSCSRCAKACSASAIDLEDGLAWQADSCRGCLSCSAVCPSGALEAEADFMGLLAAMASHPFPVLVIGCQRGDRKTHQRIPCLGMLSVEHLLALHITGGAVIQLDATACTHCPAGAMLPLLRERVEETGRLSGLPIHERVWLVTERNEILFQEEALDRRGFFQSFRKLALQGVSSVLTPAPPDRQHSYIDKSLPMRRQVLNAALASLPAEALSAVKAALCYSVSFTTSCDGCAGCARVCPTGALVEPEDDQGQPVFEQKKCCGCGLCQEFCLSNAVTVASCAT